MGEKSSNDEYSFYGALENLFSKAVAEYGKKNILVIIPNYCRFHMDINNSKNDYGVDFSEYREAIIYKVKEKNLSMLDLNDVISFDLINSDSDCGEYTFDGLHYNEKGSKIIANCVLNELEKRGIKNEY